jgi:hypothetical protein
MTIWLALLVFGTGCSCCCCGVGSDKPAPRAADLVGTWVNPGGSRLVLTDDGRFSMSDLDSCAAGGTTVAEPGRVPADGTGTWSLTGSEVLASSRPLALTFDAQPAAQTWQAARDAVSFGDPSSASRCVLTRA